MAKALSSAWIVVKRSILVRYLEKMETASLVFLKDIEGFQWNNPPENNFVDHDMFEKLRQLQILPSDLCSDEEFVRRVYLDVIGQLPSVGEAQAFLADQSPDKRAKLINALLDRPEYADFWALKWADLLRLRGQQGHARRRVQVSSLAGGGVARQHAGRQVRPNAIDGRRQHVRQSGR